MATLAQIQAAVNARLADFWDKVRTKQENYRTNHGRYWQGLVFSTVPDDGALVTPDFTVCPADQYTLTYSDPGPQGQVTEIRTMRSWAWASVGSDLPSQVEAQMRIDVYEGPPGTHGYRLTCRVSKNGITYRRTGHVEMGTVVTTGSWAAE